MKKQYEERIKPKIRIPIGKPTKIVPSKKVYDRKKYVWKDSGQTVCGYPIWMLRLEKEKV